MVRARRIVHAGVLAIANLGGIWVGFLAFDKIGAGNQISVQLPVAVLFSLAVFTVWAKLMNTAGPARFRFHGRNDGPWVYCLTPVLAAVVFVPLHFATVGYLTALTNVLALWGFQLVANMFVVPVTTHFVRPGPEASA